MDFDTQFREILELDHEPYVGVKHCSNCLAFNAIKQLIESKQPEKKPVRKAPSALHGMLTNQSYVIDQVNGGYNAALDAWREGMNL